MKTISWGPIYRAVKANSWLTAASTGYFKALLKYAFRHSTTVREVAIMIAACTPGWDVDEIASILTAEAA